MNVEELIDKLNDSFPTLSQIIERFQRSNAAFDESKSIEFRKKNLIRLNEHLLSYQNQIEHLIYNTNVSSIGIGAISFFSEFKIVDETYYAFGSYNDAYKFCLVPSKNSIVSYGEEFEEIEPISNSIEHFIDFLYVYERFDKYFVFKGDFPKADLEMELNNLISEGFSKSLVDELIIQGLPLNS